MLNGHLLADRYLGRYERATATELAAWLDFYAGQPDAGAIHALLVRRLPRGTAAPAMPSQEVLGPPAREVPGPEDTVQAGEPAFTRNPLLDRTVAARAAAGETGSALRLIARTRGLSAAYGAQLRAEVAQVQFTRNEDAQALATAEAALRNVPAASEANLAGYVAGLAAWRLDLIELAVPYFERAAHAPNATPAQRTAAAFWAGRGHLRIGEPVEAAKWLRQAASEPHTFYGLLARQTLGLGGGFEWDRETLSGADIDAIAATPEGLRAFALLQVGQTDRAEAELRLLWPKLKDLPPLRNAFLLVASEAGFTELAAQVAALVQSADGKPRDFDRFPVPRLRPRGGFRVDPALVYALTRLESNFDAGAISPVGARGLMQLMPVTAGYIAGDPSLAAGAERLHDPALNLELGQRYVRYLARHEAVEGDLIALLASYNSGPTAFAHWSATIQARRDPLLFIEAIPVAETRAFVQHALAYTWIYAERLHLPAPSLSQIADGAFPRFVPLDRTEAMVPAGLPLQ